MPTTGSGSNKGSTQELRRNSSIGLEMVGYSAADDQPGTSSQLGLFLYNNFNPIFDQMAKVDPQAKFYSGAAVKIVKRRIQHRPSSRRAKEAKKPRSGTTLTVTIPTWKWLGLQVAVPTRIWARTWESSSRRSDWPRTICAHSIRNQRAIWKSRSSQAKFIVIFLLF